MHENNSLYKELLEIIFTKLNIQSNKKKVIVTGIYGDPVQEQSKGFPPTFKKNKNKKVTYKYILLSRYLYPERRFIESETETKLLFQENQLI